MWGLSIKPKSDIIKRNILKQMPPKKIPFYKKKKYYVLITLILIGVSWIIFAMTRTKEPVITTVKAARTDLVQEVSVTGSVEPAESVNLSFEISGKVSEIFAKVGDRVTVGQKLISLNSSELQAQLRQAQAGAASAQALIPQQQAAVDAQKAILEELKRGARPEDIRISQTAVENARRALTDARNQHESVVAKAEADLNSIYETARTALPGAVDIGKASLLTLSDIQSAYFTDTNQDKFRIETLKSAAVADLLGGINAGSWVRQFISTLSGGVYGKVQNLSIGASETEIDSILRETINALQKVKLALNAVPINEKISAADVLKMDSEKTSVNSQINLLSGNEQAISLQKATNDSLISAAENAVNTAQNNLSSASDQLVLKMSGASDEQIKSQEAQVKQAQAYLASQRAQVSSQYAIVQNYQAQLEKAILYAPISGLVTKMEAKVGEVVFPSSPYSDSRMVFVAIISDKNYEIETDVAEVDIAKIKIGDTCKVTLDAYGQDEVFEAVVSSVDPAETIVENIPTYKVTLQFVGENEKIKSGMTANLDIKTNKRGQVIAIPQRAVISNAGKKYVKILKGEQNVIEVEVTTGITGSNGTIEILSGINEGDLVVLSIE